MKIAFHTALENISGELEVLAEKAAVIDEALGDAIAAKDGPSGALPRTLMQDVDLVRQSADCLRIIMGNLVKLSSQAAQPPDHLWTKTVTEGVYLAALRDRMAVGPDLELEELEELSDWIDM